MGVCNFFTNYICNFFLLATVTCALISCLSPFYSFTGQNVPNGNTSGMYGGSVGIWNWWGSPRFCDGGFVFSPSNTGGTRGTSLSDGVLYINPNHNLGNCNGTPYTVLQVFSIATVAFSGLSLFFNNVMDEVINPKLNALVSFGFSFLTLGSSLAVILTYIMLVNPSGAFSPNVYNNGDGVCALVFNGLPRCSEHLEWGFWFQVACAFGSVMSLILLVCKTIFSKTDLVATWRNTLTKLLRFMEFCLILVATFAAYDEVTPISENALDIEFQPSALSPFRSEFITTSLWDNALCDNAGFYRYFSLQGLVTASNNNPQNYGDCGTSIILLVQILICVALGLSASTTAGRHNARKSLRLARKLVLSLIFELFTLGFTVAVATIYILAIYPSRNGMDWCKTINSWWLNKTSQTSGCVSPRLSYGIFVLFVAIGVTFASIMSTSLAPATEKISLRAALLTFKEGPEEEQQCPAVSEIEDMPPPPPPIEDEEADSEHEPEQYEDLDISIIRSDTGEEESPSKSTRYLVAENNV
ncbi:hypothetical protein TrVE_jg7057 [Triparma verrucosa]|uniref:Uncharacterized protein n=1 Tax=Triparma verrucosa TaxID=1606542 RepID=A0A9W7BNU6_9STRA|nr:hypothetical protein TrVE_jg7057 [Triparma verrucosa]